MPKRLRRPDWLKTGKTHKILRESDFACESVS